MTEGEKDPDTHNLKKEFDLLSEYEQNVVPKNMKHTATTRRGRTLKKTCILSKTTTVTI